MLTVLIPVVLAVFLAVISGYGVWHAFVLLAFYVMGMTAARHWAITQRVMENDAELARLAERMRKGE